MTLNVYQIGEELYAAPSPVSAVRIFLDMTGELPDEEPRELSEAELDAPQPEFDEDERETGGKTSVRQMLTEHGDEPGWLAGPVV